MLLGNNELVEKLGAIGDIWDLILIDNEEDLETILTAFSGETKELAKEFTAIINSSFTYEERLVELEFKAIFFNDVVDEESIFVIENLATDPEYFNKVIEYTKQFRIERLERIKGKMEAVVEEPVEEPIQEVIEESVESVEAVEELVEPGEEVEELVEPGEEVDEVVKEVVEPVVEEVIGTAEESVEAVEERVVEEPVKVVEEPVEETVEEPVQETNNFVEEQSAEPSDLELLLGEVDRLTSLTDTLENQNKEKDEMLSLLSVKLDELEISNKKIEELENQLKLNVLSVSERDSLIEQLNGEKERTLQEWANDRQSLLSTIDSLKIDSEQVEELRTLNTQLQAELEKYISNSTLTESGEELEALKQRVAQLENEKLTLSTTIKEKDSEVEGILKSLETALEDARNNVTLKEKELSEVKEVVTSKESEITQLAETANELLNENTLYSTEIKNLKDKVNEISDKINLLTQEVELKDSEILKLTERLKNTEDIEQTTADVNTAVELIKSTFLSLEKNGIIVDELRNKTFSLNVDLPILIKKLKESKNDESNTKVSSSVTRSYELKIEEYESNFKELRASLANANSELKSKQAIIAKLNSTISSLRKNSNSLESDKITEEFKLKNEILQKELEEINKERQTLKEELENVTVENENMSAKLTEIYQNGFVSEETTEEFKEKLAELQRDIIKKDAEKESLESRITKLLKDYVKDLVEITCNLSGTLDDDLIKEQVNDKMHLIKSEEMDIHSVLEDLKTNMLSQVTELRTEKSETSSDVNNKLEEIDLLKSELDNYKSEKLILEERVRNMERDNLALIDRNKDLENKNNLLEKDNEDLLAKAVELDDSIKALEARIEELELEQENLKSFEETSAFEEESNEEELEVARQLAIAQESILSLEKERDILKNEAQEYAETIDSLYKQLNEVPTGDNIIQVSKDDIRQLFPVITMKNAISSEKMLYIKELGSSTFTDDLISYLAIQLGYTLKDTNSAFAVIVFDNLEDDARVNIYHNKGFAINETLESTEASKRVLVTDSLAFSEIKEMATMNRLNNIIFIDRRNKEERFVVRDDVDSLYLLNDMYLASKNIPFSQYVTPFKFEGAHSYIELPSNYSALKFGNRMNALLESNFLGEAIKKFKQTN